MILVQRIRVPGKKNNFPCVRKENIKSVSSPVAHGGRGRCRRRLPAIRGRGWNARLYREKGLFIFFHFNIWDGCRFTLSIGGGLDCAIAEAEELRTRGDRREGSVAADAGWGDGLLMEAEEEEGGGGGWGLLPVVVVVAAVFPLLLFSMLCLQSSSFLLRPWK